MEIAENILLRSQGVVEPRRGFRSSALPTIPINAFGYKADQKKLLAVAYDSPSLPALSPTYLGHRTRFGVYDWQADTWAQAYMLPGNMTFDRPRAGVPTRFMGANLALFLQGRYGLLKMEDAAQPMQLTNLIRESSRLATSPWSSLNTTVSNYAASGPDMSGSAAKLQATAVNGFHQILHPVQIVTGNNYCFSAEVQAGTVSWFGLGDDVGRLASFDLANGIAYTDTANASAAMYPVPGQPGWYRCVVNYTGLTTAGAPTANIYLEYAATRANLGPQWTAAGTETIFVFGVQFEVLGPYSPAPLLQTINGTASRSNPTLRPAMLLKPWTQPVGSTWAGSKPALTTSGSWLLSGNQVAYRITVARKGANRELIESEPSERCIVANQSGTPQGVSWIFDAHPMYPRDAFLRLWRSQQVPVTQDASDEMFLIAELQMPALAPLGADGYIALNPSQTATLNDFTPDTALFIPLYTNPATGEGRGLLDSNNTAPLARDMAIFKQRAYYCGTRDVHRLIIKVIGTGSGGIQANSSITIAGVTFNFATNDMAALGPQVFTAGTVAQNLENTARALVAHINNYFAGRASAAYPGLPGVVYASYIGVTATSAGQILLQRVVPGAEPIVVTTSSRAGWDRDYTTPFTSDDNYQPAGLAWSKQGQPEAVPIANTAIVGDTAMDALRVIPLREAGFLFKRDGLYKITDDGTGPTITLLDPTIKLIAPETAVAIDNVIIALTESGVILVSEGSGAVNISDDQIGRPLRKLVLSVGSAALSSLAYGVAYQGQRIYILALPESSAATACTLYYVYNLQTQAWTTMTLPLPTTAGLSQFDANALYFSAPLPLGDSFRGFMIERTMGGSDDYKDLPGVLRSPTNTATNTLTLPGNLTLPVFSTPNFIIDSQDRFAQSNWQTTNAIGADNVTNLGAAPDGGSNVSTLTDNATLGAHTISQAQTLEPGQVYTFSHDFKQPPGGLGFAALDTGTGANAIFNIGAGTISAANFGSAQILAQGNGWFRCAFTFTFVSASSAVTLAVQIGDTAAHATPGNTYAGTGQSILLWGAQIERNPAMTPYIATPLRPAPLAVGDVLQQFQGTKALTQTVTAVSFSSATGLTTVTLDAAPATAWTLTDDITVSKAVQSRIRMLPQHVDHPLTAKIWREAFLSFRYLDLDFLQVDWQSEAFQYSSKNPAQEQIASSVIDSAPILVLPFSNSAGPFAQYVWGRQTRDVVLKATLHQEVLSAGQLILGVNLGQAGRRFELSGFDIVMSGKTERTVR